MITRYEIVAEHPDGRSYLIGYTPRRSRPGLLAAIRKHAESAIAKLDIGQSDTMSWSTKPTHRCIVSNGWTVKFSGRTQLDVEREGTPLPPVWQ